MPHTRHRRRLRTMCRRAMANIHGPRTQTWRHPRHQGKYEEIKNSGKVLYTIVERSWKVHEPCWRFLVWLIPGPLNIPIEDSSGSRPFRPKFEPEATHNPDQIGQNCLEWIPHFPDLVAEFSTHPYIIRTSHSWLQLPTRTSAYLPYLFYLLAANDFSST